MPNFDENMTNFDENLILEKAQSGDKRAETELLLHYMPYVKKVASSYSLAGGDSDDVVQSGMIGLSRAVKKYDKAKHASFKTFATTCIKHSILDEIKRAQTQKNSPLNDSVSIEDESNHSVFKSLNSAKANVESEIIDQEMTKLFFDAIDNTLQSDEKAVFDLYLSSMPYKEISKTLDMSMKRVDNTIYQAKKKIKKIIEQLNSN